MTYPSGKVAVLINGIYRTNVKPGPEKLQADLLAAFPYADFYYHTWQEYELNIPLKYRHNLHYCPEPKLNYHPVQDAGPAKHGKYADYKKKKLLHNKMANASKQILGYADLYKKVNAGYDLFIRARWDTAIDRQFDFEKYLWRAEEVGPVGFGFRGNRGQKFGGGKEYTVDRENKMDDWFGFVPDVLIMHHRRHFDPSFVTQLHKDKELLPAEWGWYQVLSEPYGDIHNSIHGGAMIAR